ncbi:MAG: hypothetical protein LiPW30_143 [Parcubacteria group bacterium LiPW_30]|nr:MAG: hypothetical protein LiPW30_143 [Parcubacteria group bacterium LiPW_30]
MVKKTKHGRVSNGSGWGRSSCDECDESTNGKEVILIYYPLEDHVERYDVTCFLKKNPRHRVRYEIVMAIMAVNGVPEAFQGNGCNLCEQSTEGEDVLVSYVQKKGASPRKFFGHLSCFMGEDEVRSAPDVHISTR